MRPIFLDKIGDLRAPRNEKSSLIVKILYSCGISFLPTLTGQGVQRPHDSLYWEYNNQQAVRTGTWKAFRPDARGRPDEQVQLFDLENDPAEEHDLAEQHPDIVRELVEMMNSRMLSEFDKWNFPPAPMPDGTQTT